MTENDIWIFLGLLWITVIPISLYIIVTITKDLDEDIKKIDEIGKWTKKELDRRADDDE